MEHLNKIELQGVVGSVRTDKVGDKLHAHFTVATNYLYKTADGNAVCETTWHRVSAFEGEKITADTLNTIKDEYNKNYVHVRVVGRLRQKRYTDEFGNDASTYEVFANEVELID